MLADLIEAAVPFISAADQAPGAPDEAPAMLRVTVLPAWGAVHVVAADAEGRARRIFRALADDVILDAAQRFLSAGFDSLPADQRRQALDAITFGALLAVSLTRGPDRAAALLVAPTLDVEGTTGPGAVLLFSLTEQETLH